MSIGEHESLCKRCGKCCGVIGHGPCAHLDKLPDGKYSCSIYEHRLGDRITVDGEKFRCGLISELKAKGWLPEGCGYE